MRTTSQQLVHREGGKAHRTHSSGQIGSRWGVQRRLDRSEARKVLPGYIYVCMRIDWLHAVFLLGFATGHQDEFCREITLPSCRSRLHKSVPTLRPFSLSLDDEQTNHIIINKPHHHQQTTSRTLFCSMDRSFIVGGTGKKGRERTVWCMPCVATTD